MVGVGEGQMRQEDDYEDGDEDRMSIARAKEWLYQRKPVDIPSRANTGLLSALKAAMAVEGADAVYVLTDGVGNDKKVKVRFYD